MTEGETARLARTGAVAGLCPTTEANLGDGFFHAPEFLRNGGIFGIGSDSQISVSPLEELRWLEYGQRLLHRRRNVLAAGANQSPSVGASLYRAALAGGAQALGRPIGKLAAGCRADLIVIDAEMPTLIGKPATFSSMPWFSLATRTRCATSWSAAAGSYQKDVTSPSRPFSSVTAQRSLN